MHAPAAFSPRTTRLSDRSDVFAEALTRAPSLPRFRPLPLPRFASTQRAEHASASAAAAGPLGASSSFGSAGGSLPAASASPSAGRPALMRKTSFDAKSGAVNHSIKTTPTAFFAFSD